jgi:hypothetical protein
MKTNLGANWVEIEGCTCCGQRFDNPVLAPHGHGFCSVECLDKFKETDCGICCEDHVYYILNTNLEW